MLKQSSTAATIYRIGNINKNNSHTVPYKTKCEYAGEIKETEKLMPIAVESGEQSQSHAVYPAHFS